MPGFSESSWLRTRRRDPLARLVPGARPAPRSGPPSTLARFVVEEQSAGFLPAPPNVDAVDADKGPIVLDRFGLVHAPSPAPDRYAIAYTPGPMPVRERDDDIVRETTTSCASVCRFRRRPT